MKAKISKNILVKFLVVAFMAVVLSCTYFASTKTSFASNFVVAETDISQDSGSTVDGLDDGSSGSADDNDSSSNTTNSSSTFTLESFSLVESNGCSTASINTAGKLAYFASKVNGNASDWRSASVYLTADIDLSGKIWTPIGNGSGSSFVTFTGIFDGQGHTITGLTIDTSVLSTEFVYAGLFGRTSGATIKNFTMTDVSIAGGSSATCAAVVGAAGDTTISNVVVLNGSVSGYNSITTGGVTAAIAAGLGGTIQNCFAGITVTPRAGDNSALIGKADTDGVIVNRVGTNQNYSIVGTGSATLGDWYNSEGGKIANSANWCTASSDVPGATINGERQTIKGVGNVAIGYKNGTNVEVVELYSIYATKSDYEKSSGSEYAFKTIEVDYQYGLYSNLGFSGETKYAQRTDPSSIKVKFGSDWGVGVPEFDENSKIDYTYTIPEYFQGYLKIETTTSKLAKLVTIKLFEASAMYTTMYSGNVYFVESNKSKSIEITNTKIQDTNGTIVSSLTNNTQYYGLVGDEFSIPYNNYNGISIKTAPTGKVSSLYNTDDSDHEKITWEDFGTLNIYLHNFNRKEIDTLGGTSSDPYAYLIETTIVEIPTITAPVGAEHGVNSVLTLLDFNPLDKYNPMYGDGDIKAFYTIESVNYKPLFTEYVKLTKLGSVDLSTTISGKTSGKTIYGLNNKQEKTVGASVTKLYCLWKRSTVNVKTILGDYGNIIVANVSGKEMSKNVYGDSQNLYSIPFGYNFSIRYNQYKEKYTFSGDSWKFSSSNYSDVSFDYNSYDGKLSFRPKNLSGEILIATLSASDKIYNVNFAVYVKDPATGKFTLKNELSEFLQYKTLSTNVGSLTRKFKESFELPIIKKENSKEAYTLQTIGFGKKIGDSNLILNTDLCGTETSVSGIKSIIVDEQNSAFDLRDISNVYISYFLTPKSATVNAGIKFNNGDWLKKDQTKQDISVEPGIFSFTNSDAYYGSATISSGKEFQLKFTIPSSSGYVYAGNNLTDLSSNITGVSVTQDGETVTITGSDVKILEKDAIDLVIYVNYNAKQTKSITIKNVGNLINSASSEFYTKSGNDIIINNVVNYDSFKWYVNSDQSTTIEYYIATRGLQHSINLKTNGYNPTFKNNGYEISKNSEISLYSLSDNTIEMSLTGKKYKVQDMVNGTTFNVVYNENLLNNISFINKVGYTLTKIYLGTSAQKSNIQLFEISNGKLIYVPSSHIYAGVSGGYINYSTTQSSSSPNCIIEYNSGIPTWVGADLAEDSTVLYLYPEYIPNEYSVTFDTNGGTFGGSNSVDVTLTYGSPVSCFDSSSGPALALPSWVGHKFLGFFDSITGGKQYVNADGESLCAWDKTSDATLYAHWEAINYIVTFNANGGCYDNDSSNTSFTQNITYNSAFTASKIPSRAGYKFVGFYDAAEGGTQYVNANGASVKNWDKTSKSTLYAHWEYSSYKITLKDDADENSYNNTPINNLCYFVSANPADSNIYSKQDISKVATTPIPIKNGYIFDGYYTYYKSGAGKKVLGNNNGTLTYLGNISADTTLYVKWVVDPGYLFFDSTQETTNFTYDGGYQNVNTLTLTATINGVKLEINGFTLETYQMNKNSEIITKNSQYYANYASFLTQSGNNCNVKYVGKYAINVQVKVTHSTTYIDNNVSYSNTTFNIEMLAATVSIADLTKEFNGSNSNPTPTVSGVYNNEITITPNRTDCIRAGKYTLSNTDFAVSAKDASLNNEAQQAIINSYKLPSTTTYTITPAKLTLNIGTSGYAFLDKETDEQQGAFILDSSALSKASFSKIGNIATNLGSTSRKMVFRIFTNKSYYGTYSWGDSDKYLTYTITKFLFDDVSYIDCFEVENITGSFRLLEGTNTVTIKFVEATSDNFDASATDLGAYNVNVVETTKPSIYTSNYQGDGAYTSLSYTISKDSTKELQLRLDLSGEYWVKQVIVNGVQQNIITDDILTYNFDQQNATIYVVLTKYTKVTFNYNLVEGETINSKASDVGYFENGKTITVPAISRKGYTFIGWYDSSDIKFETGASYTNKINELTLSAKWSQNGLSSNIIDVSETSWTYDGNVRTLKIVISDSDYNSYINYIVLLNGNQVKVSPSKISGGYSLYSIDLKNVTDSKTYEFEIKTDVKTLGTQEVTISISKRNITLNVTDSKVYDAATFEHTLQTSEIANIVSNQTVSGSVVTNSSFAGTYNASSSVVKNFAIKDSSGTSTTANYNVSLNINLTIEKRSATLTVNSAKEYDGLVLDYNLTTDNFDNLVENSQISGKISTISTNLGKYSEIGTQITPNFDILLNGVSVKDNYNIIYNVTLEITNKVLTITLEVSKTYDSELFTYSLQNANATGLMGQEALTGSISTVSANAGIYSSDLGNLTYDIDVKKGGVSVKDNYSIVYNVKLTINKKVIDLSLDSTVYTKQFDNTKIYLTLFGLTEKDRNIVEIKLETSSANVGDYSVAVASVVLRQGVTDNDANKAICGNYTILSSGKEIKITAKQISISSVFESTYNGKAQQIVIDSQVSSGIYTNDSVTLTFDSIVNAGSYTLKDYAFTQNNKNYQINFTDSAKLQVNKLDVTVSVPAGGFTKTYDGQELILASGAVVGPLTYKLGNLNGLTSSVITYSVDRKAVVAGTYTITFKTASGYENNITLSGDVSAKAEIKQKDVTLNITASKIYDNKVLSVAVVRDNFDNIVDGDQVTGTVSTTSANVGEYTGSGLLYSFDITKNGDSVKDSYNITYNVTLTISKTQIGASLQSKTTIFNAEPQTLSVQNADGFTITYTYQKDSAAGEVVLNAISAGIYYVTAKIEGNQNYEDKTLNAYLTIVKKDIYIQLQNAEKAFDNTKTYLGTYSVFADSKFSVEIDFVNSSYKNYKPTLVLEYASELAANQVEINITLGTDELSDNYNLKTTSALGKITKRNAPLYIHSDFTEYYGNVITISGDGSNGTLRFSDFFNFNDGLVTANIVYTGANITLPILDVGTYGIEEIVANILKVTDKSNLIDFIKTYFTIGNGISADNYNFTYSNSYLPANLTKLGNLIIKNAIVRVKTANTTLTYSATAQLPTFQIERLYGLNGLSLTNSDGILNSTEYVVSNTSGISAIDVGEYDFAITLNNTNIKFDNESQILADKFTIAAKNVEVKATLKAKITELKKQFDLTSSNFSGLAASHSATGTVSLYPGNTAITKVFDGNSNKLEELLVQISDSTGIIYNYQISYANGTISVTDKNGTSKPQNYTFTYNITVEVSSIGDIQDNIFADEDNVYEFVYSAKDLIENGSIAFDFAKDGNRYSIKYVNDAANGYSNNPSIITFSQIKLGQDFTNVAKFVGEYSFTVETIDNLPADNVTLRFKIVPKPIDFAGDVNKVYDGTSANTTLGIHQTSICENDQNKFSLTFKYQKDGKDVAAAGTGYNIVVSSVQDSENLLRNYSYNSGNVQDAVLTGNITLKDATVSLAQNISKEYDGNNIVLTNSSFTFDNLVPTESFSLKQNVNFAEINVGKYTLQNILSALGYESLNAFIADCFNGDASNYNFAISGENTITITTANLTIETYENAFSKVYDAKAISIDLTSSDLTKTTYKISGLKNQDPSPVQVAFFLSDGVTEITAPINAGEYKVKFTTTNNNYVIANAEFNLTISKKGISIYYSSTDTYQPTSDYQKQVQLINCTSDLCDSDGQRANFYITFSLPLVGGESVGKGDYDFSIQNVTDSEVTQNSVKVSIDSVGLFNNYKIDLIQGKLSVAAAEFESVELNSLSLEFDTQCHELNLTNLPTTGLNTITYTISQNGTLVAKYTVTTKGSDIPSDKTFTSGALPYAAGTYSVTAYLKNPNYVAKEYSSYLTINKKAINLYLQNIQKVYDGTTDFTLTGSEITVYDSSNVLLDTINVFKDFIPTFVVSFKTADHGTYKPNSTDGKKLFVQLLDNDINKNFVISSVNGEGIISLRKLQVQIDTTEVYNYKNTYSLDTSVISNLSALDLAGEHKVKETSMFTVVLTQVGEYDVKTIFTDDVISTFVIVDKNNDVTANYDITFEGKVTITKKQISVQKAGDSSFEYNAKQVTENSTYGAIAFVVNSNFTQEEIAQTSLEIIPVYAGTDVYGNAYNSLIAPKNVGQYIVTATIENTNYELVGTLSYNFEITLHSYEISEENIAGIKRFSKSLKADDPELSAQIVTDLNETVTIYFTREQGENVGLYDIEYKQDSCTNKNYVITCRKLVDMFEIAKNNDLQLNIIVKIDENADILQKIYNGLEIGDIDISTLAKYYNVTKVSTGEVVISQQDYTEGEVVGQLYSSMVNVGVWELETKALSHDNYSLISITFEDGSKVNFTITKREFSISADFDKIYDKTTNFIGNYEITYPNSAPTEAEKQAMNLNDNTIKLAYASQNADQNIDILVTYAGVDSNNFTYVPVYGNILQRQIVVTPVSNQSSTYSQAKTFEDMSKTIAYDVSYDESYKQNLKDTLGAEEFISEFSGNLQIELQDRQNKFVAGTYKIINNLTSSNIAIQFTDGITFTIEQKLIQAKSDRQDGLFTKIYDENTAVTNQIILLDVIDGDVVTATATYQDAAVGFNKTITFVLAGEDANNYYIQPRTDAAITDLVVKMLFNYNPDNYTYSYWQLNNASIEGVDLIYNKTITESIGNLPIPSHFENGYSFIGWYFDLSDETTKISNETLISGAINWNLSDAEKTVYAKWQINEFDVEFVVLTKSQGNYQETPAVYGGKFVKDLQNEELSSDIYKLTGKFNYKHEINISDIFKVTDGFNFAGISLSDSNSEALKDIETIVVESKYNYVFFKFDPKTAVITLNANGGVFEYNQEWSFNQDFSIASKEVEYLTQTPILPNISRRGYSLVCWLNEDAEYTLPSTIDFYQDKTLTASWNALTFKLTVSAGIANEILGDKGSFNADDIDTSIWQVQTDSNGNIVAIVANVNYDQNVQFAIKPFANGYTFVNYVYENNGEKTYYEYSENSGISFIFQQISDVTLTATYSENIYKINVRTKNLQLNYWEVKDVNGNSLTTIDGKTIVVYDAIEDMFTFEVKTSYSLNAQFVGKDGYTFKQFTFNSDTTDVSGLQTDRQTIDDEIIGILAFARTKQNLDITVEYDQVEYTITVNIVSNNADKDSVAKVAHSEFSSSNGTLTVVAKTEDVVNFVVTAFEGYYVYIWQIEDDQKGTTVLQSTTSEASVKGFLNNITISVVIKERINTIEVKTSYYNETELQGTFNYGIYTQIKEYSISCATDSFFEIEIHPNKGFVVDTNVANWQIETESVNKGIFEFTMLQDGVYKLKVSGFTADGIINLLYLLDSYTISFKTHLYDSTRESGEYIESELINDFITINGVSYQSKGSITESYHSLIAIGFSNVQIEGYTFDRIVVLKDGERVEISNINGFISNQDDVLSFELLEDVEIYYIYSINSYTVKFELSNKKAGTLIVNKEDVSQSQTVPMYFQYYESQVKYGYTIEEVTAVANKNYLVSGWSQNDSLIQTEATIKDKVITSDTSFIAQFEGQEYNYIVKVQIRDKDDTKDYSNFASISTEETITVLSEENGLITYQINGRGKELKFQINTDDKYQVSVISSPNSAYTVDGNQVTILNTNGDANSDTIDGECVVYISEKTYQVKLGLSGENGLIEVDNNNSSGVTVVDSNDSRSEVTATVKYGYTVQFVVYVKKGFKIDTTDLETKAMVVQNDIDKSYYTSSILVKFENVTENVDITIPVSNIKYKVSFVLDAENSVIEDYTIDYQSNTFDSAVSQNVMYPTKERYQFMGWTEYVGGGRVNYTFDEYGNICYTENYVTKTGFVGGETEKESTEAGYDYTIILYPQWQIITYSVKAVFVPNVLNAEPISFNEMYPNTHGRYVDIVDNNTLINYTIGYPVLISAPETLSGMTYLGYSFSSTATREEITAGNFYKEAMTEESILVYLYYEFNIDVGVQGVGSATCDKQKAIVGETINLTATPGLGYEFAYWLEDGTKVSTEQNFSTVVSDYHSYTAVFIGKRVTVELNEYIEGQSKGRFSVTSPQDEIYRVGSVIEITVDTLYGYELNSSKFSGTYNGTIRVLSSVPNKFYYTITPQDGEQGVIKILGQIDPIKIIVKFVLDGGQGELNVNDQIVEFNQNYQFDYDSSLTVQATAAIRHRLSSITFNQTSVTETILISQTNGFDVTTTNVFTIKFDKLYWIDLHYNLDGMGTELSPYIIASAEDLSTLAYLVNNKIESGDKTPYNIAYYKVMATIDLSARFWTPIGTEENPFDGIFNIDISTITNIVIDASIVDTTKIYNGYPKELYGLFGVVGKNFKIIVRTLDTKKILLVSGIIVLVVIAIAGIFVFFIVRKRRRLRKMTKTNITDLKDINIRRE